MVTKKDKGFTLAEIIVTVVIIAILSGTIIINVSSAFKYSEKGILEKIQTSLNTGRYNTMAVANGVLAYVEIEKDADTGDYTLINKSGVNEDKVSLCDSRYTFYLCVTQDGEETEYEISDLKVYFSKKGGGFKSIMLNTTQDISDGSVDNMYIKVNNGNCKLKLALLTGRTVLEYE